MFGNPAVREFERTVSKMLGGAPVLGVNSGTSALISALKVLGIGPGDEVIVPAFGFVSTASSILSVGATPVFTDIRLHDYAFDPSKISEKVTDRTKAIIVAHLFGQGASGMGEILKIAAGKSLFVIEDAAQSFGAKIRIDGQDRFVGTLGDIGCFSFSSTKPLSAPGNAGAIVFQKKDALYETVDKGRTYGQQVIYRDHRVVGVNDILQELQAAALLVRFDFLDYWLAHRKKLAEYYTKQLVHIKDIILPETVEGNGHTWYRYTIRTARRDALFSHLTKGAGRRLFLQPTIYYPVPLPYLTVFHQEHKTGDFPMSEQAAAEVLSLPIYNITTMEDVQKTVESVKEFFQK